MFDTTLSRRLDVHGVELAWDSWGSAEDSTILLCHGFSGSSHEFALHVEGLAESNRVMAFDHRGHGLSTNVGSVDAYSIKQMSNDVIALIDAHAGGSVTLLGHSLGGRVALEVALERPDLLRSLILMDTSAWSFKPTDPTMSEIVGNIFREIDETGDLQLPDFRLPEDDLIEASTSDAWRARRDELRALLDPCAVKSLGIELFADGIVSVRDRLGEITCPVTVIVGSLDETYSQQAPQLAQEIGGSLSVIEGGYHSPQLTHPNEWRSIVLGHLDALEDSGRNAAEQARPDRG